MFVRKIIVCDNGEPLVDVRKYVPGVKINLGSKRRQEKTAYLRLSVVKMLAKAQKYLPWGMNFVIGDAWRPDYIQCDIYFGFMKRFRQKYPLWSRKRVVSEVEKFVAPWKGKNAGGHLSGGAIDLRLIDKRGRKIPMKSRYLSYQENALSEQPKLPEYIRKNRQIMFDALTKAGLSNYPKEYWHWSYGDYYWVKRLGKNRTIYGPAEDKTGFYENKLCPCGVGKKFKRCHGQ